jgi:putative ATP-dependent endonuclease of OLD family
MRLFQLQIKNFRGIKSLEWTPKSNLICLIGCGDATKTTILDAIDLALSPRWELQLDDSDFFNGDHSKPIQIDATVGPVPDGLIKDTRFGMELRGWTPEGTLRDEPSGSDIAVLTVRLIVDSSLEPRWIVVNDRNPDGREIHTRDREQFGVTRLGALINKHLGWERRSALYRLTGSPDELPSILATAHRAAKQVIGEKELTKFSEVATTVQRLVSDVGIAPKVKYGAKLDIQNISFNQGGLAIHDGEVPLRRAGLGTRRLITLAIQREVARQGGIILIDELEYGLEPHRIRRLLQSLRQRTTEGQIIFTSHSATVLIEQTASDVNIVRSNGETTQALPAEDALQPILRASPEAFMAQSVLVCEGRTEQGFVRYLDQWWASSNLPSFGYLGVAPIDGRGDAAPARAEQLADLGYKVAYLRDSDVKYDSGNLEKKGVSVITWEGDVSIEQRIALDLPWEGILEIIQSAITERGDISVRQTVANHLGVKIDSVSPDLKTWKDSNDLRVAIGKAAKGKKEQPGWFKNIDGGEELGRITCNYLNNIKTTDLALKIVELRKWLDQDASETTR